MSRITGLNTLTSELRQSRAQSRAQSQVRAQSAAQVQSQSQSQNSGRSRSGSRNPPRGIAAAAAELGADVVPQLVTQQQQPRANHEDGIPLSHLGLMKADPKRARSVSFSHADDNAPILKRGRGRLRKQTVVA